MDKAKSSRPWYKKVRFGHIIATIVVIFGSSFNKSLTKLFLPGKKSLSVTMTTIIFIFFRQNLTTRTYGL